MYVRLRPADPVSTQQPVLVDVCARPVVSVAFSEGLRVFAFGTLHFGGLENIVSRHFEIWNYGGSKLQCVVFVFTVEDQWYYRVLVDKLSEDETQVMAN